MNDLKGNHVSVALAVCIVALACTSKNVDSQRKANAVWHKHERVIEAVAKGEPVALHEFEQASLFFDELTGIAIPGDHSPLIDWYPNKDTASALQPLRRWYAENKENLYWDDHANKVEIRRP